jgi:hypothetical protein
MTSDLRNSPSPNKNIVSGLTNIDYKHGFNPTHRKMKPGSKLLKLYFVTFKVVFPPDCHKHKNEYTKERYQVHSSCCKSFHKYFT